MGTPGRIQIKDTNSRFRNLPIIRDRLVPRALEHWDRTIGLNRVEIAGLATGSRVLEAASKLSGTGLFHKTIGKIDSRINALQLEPINNALSSVRAENAVLRLELADERVKGFNLGSSVRESLNAYEEIRRQYEEYKIASDAVIGHLQKELQDASVSLGSLESDLNIVKDIADLIPDKIYLKDGKGRFVMANRALRQSLGVGHEKDIVGRTDFDYYDNEAASAFKKVEDRVIQYRSPIINIEQEGRDANGDPKWSLVTKVPYFNEVGDLKGVVGINRDITALKIKENELKERNKELLGFFTVISHDLRGPLGVMMGWIDLIIERWSVSNKPEMEHMLGTLRTSIYSAYALHEGLLDWAKMQLNGVTVNPVETSVTGLVGLEVDRQYSSAKNKEVSIFNMTQDGHKVFADADILSFVIRNLLSNALKFTPKGGKVFIYSMMNAGKVEIIVKDTGVGMSPEVLSGLFKDTGVTSNPGTDGEKGSGLALSQCGLLIEKNNGKITAESVPGKGSTFKIVLPSSK